MQKLMIRGHTLFLLPDKALWWPENKILMVADTHFSKDAVFRQHGIPLPQGNNQKDLSRLSAILNETAAERLIVLGDFVHGTMTEDDPFYSQLNQWQKTTTCSLEIVSGNHDRHLDKTLFSQLVWHQELSLPPFLLLHEPQERKRSYVLAGHIHPVLHISDRRTDTLRLPVFWIRNKYAVLPSFGSMTGGFSISPDKDDRIFAVGKGQIVRVM